MNRTSIVYKMAKKCEQPGNSCFWSCINFFFCQMMIFWGGVLAKRLKREYLQKRLLLFPSGSMGDSIFFAAFKEYMLECLQVSGEDTLLLCSTYLEKPLAACGITDTLPLKGPEIAALSMACRFYGEAKTHIMPVTAFFLFDYECVKDKNITPHQISFKYDISAIRQELENAQCRAGRTVVLSPYENSIKEIKDEKVPVFDFWVELADALKKAGFDVCTNCAGDDAEPPVPGTRRVFPRYADSEEFIAQAGYAIVLRSGFADLVTMTRGTLVTLYPSDIYLKHYHLWRDQGFDDHIELVCRDGAQDPIYRKQLISRIMEVL